jgi:hypothetical protein
VIRQNATKLGGRPRIDGEYQEKIEELALNNWGPAQINRELQRIFPDRPGLPTLRTIQRIVKQVRPRDTSGSWRWHDDEDPRPILDVLAVMVLRSEGRITSLTWAQVQWIRKVRKGAPDLPPETLFYCAEQYRAAEAERRDTSALDAFITLAPWRSKSARHWYDYAAKVAWIPPDPPNAYLNAQIEQLSAGLDEFPPEDSNSTQGEETTEAKGDE